jgi:hypothetical protein
MFEDSKADRIITGITRKTIEAELKWNLAQPPASLAAGSSSRFAFYAETAYKNRTLAFAHVRYKVYQDADEYDWSESYALYVLDYANRLQYEFPLSSAHRHLSQAIQEQITGVDDLFEDLLNTELPKDDIPF